MYSEHRLSSSLTLWRSQASSDGTIPADGCVDLILRHDRVFVAGPSTCAITTHADGADESIGLRFAPGTVGGPLLLPVADLRDRFVALEDVSGPRAASAWRETLRALGSPAGPTATDAALPSAFRPPEWVTLARKAASDGATALEAARLLSWSERDLRRKMRAQFGYGYAVLVRVLRAQRAYRLVRRGHTLADAAARSGYADQSHLTREFRRVAGATPGQVAGSAA